MIRVSGEFARFVTVSRAVASAAGEASIQGVRSGGPGAIRTDGRRRELHRDRPEREPVVLGLGRHAERRALVGQEPLAVVGRLDLGARLGEPGEPAAASRPSPPDRRRPGRGRGSRADGSCARTGPARRRTRRRRPPSTRSRRRRRRLRSHSAGPTHAGRRAGTPRLRPGERRSSSPRTTNATGSPSAEWFSIESVFTHTPRPSELQPVRPIIPAAVRTTVSASVRRRRAKDRLAAVHHLGQVHVLGQQRPAALAGRDRDHAARVPVAPGLRVPPLLVHQVVGEDPLERHRGPLGDAAHLLEQLGRVRPRSPAGTGSRRGGRRRARRPGCPCARPPRRPTARARSPIRSRSASPWARPRSRPEPDTSTITVRGDGHLGRMVPAAPPGPG